MKYLYFLVVITLFLGSCSSSKLVSTTSKEKISDSSSVEKQKVEFDLEEKTVKADTNILSNIKIVYIPGKPCVPVIKKIVIEKYNSDSTLYMKTVIDSLGNVQQECTQSAQKLLAEVNVWHKRTIIQREVINNYEKKIGFFQKALRWTVSFFVLFVLIAAFLGYLYFKRISKIIP